MNGLRRGKTQKMNGLRRGKTQDIQFQSVNHDCRELLNFWRIHEA